MFSRLNKLKKKQLKAESLPLKLLMTKWLLFCSQWMSVGQNLLQLVFQQICETRNLRVFFGFIFVACWTRTLKVNVNRKNWAVLRWLLLYLKEKDFFTIFEVSRNYCVNWWNFPERSMIRMRGWLSSLEILEAYIYTNNYSQHGRITCLILFQSRSNYETDTHQ